MTQAITISSPATRADLYEPSRYPDVKDPSPVFDGEQWHLFGTGCGLQSGLEILHSTSPRVEGPWREEAPVLLVGVDHITSPAAPGVCVDGRVLHMFLQHDYNRLGSDIEHLVSDDRGASFVARDTALQSFAGTAEAALYDPDPCTFGSARYLTYAAMSVVGEPELYLARSATRSWDGPWEHLGRILGHEQVKAHNQIGDPDYEWGLEGPHLLELPDGRCLLTAVCFLSSRPRGHRQRVLSAIADRPEGPYSVLGPLVEPQTHDGSGENGHGTAVLSRGQVHLVYQERAGAGRPWRYRRAVLSSALAHASPENMVADDVA
jgi:hypothetical protein